MAAKSNHITAGQSSPLHKDGSRKIMQITQQQNDAAALWFLIPSSEVMSYSNNKMQ